MKREGRQHGVVRTSRILPDPLNPKPESRIINKLECPPTAGLFHRVPAKPTNHSKFTGKCGRASKSKDKAKGSHKLRSSDHHLISFSGLSASGMLDLLTCTDDFCDGDELGENDEDEENLGEIGEETGMSYCDVGFRLEEIEIEYGEWCVVAEL